MGGNSVESDGLGIASSALTLTNSVLGSNGTVAAVGRLAVAIHEWRIRERIPESLYDIWQNQAKGLAYPNERGLALLGSIEDVNTYKLSKAPLSLVRAGSLGRWLATSNELAYVVSTCAVLYEHHDTQAITDVLTHWMIERHAIKIQWTKRALSNVVGKVVNSVYVNTVNAGLVKVSLPERLDAVHGHALRAEVLARYIHAITKAEDAHLFLKSSTYCSNLVSWLLHHYEGSLEIFVGNEKLHEQTGLSQGRLVVHCNQCSTEQCSTETELRLGLMDGPGLINLSSQIGTDIDVGHYPFHVNDTSRIPFRALFLEAEAAQADLIAAQIVQWTLDLRLKSSIGRMAFETSPTGTRFESFFRSYPSLCQGLLDKDQPMLDQLIPMPPGQLVDSLERIASCPHRHSESLRMDPPEEQLPLFKELMWRCACLSCATQESRRLPWGCLRVFASSYILSAVASAFAEISGLEWISGSGAGYLRVNDMSVPRHMGELLRKLWKDTGILHWGPWFTMLAHMSTGMSFEALNSAATDGMLLAVQRGSLVVIPDWADMSKRTDGPLFALTVYTGCNIQGTSGDVALITAAVMESSSHDSHQSKLDKCQPFEVPLNTLHFTSHTALMPGEGSTQYEMMTVVRIGDGIMKVVDPCLAVQRSVGLGETRTGMKPLCGIGSSCQHTVGPVSCSTKSVQILDAGGVRATADLTPWKPNRALLLVTPVLSTQLEVNIALSLITAGETVIVNVDEECLQCVLDHIPVEVENLILHRNFNAIAVR